MSKVCAFRFNVYCREQGFLDACDYPDGRESDEYDAQSFHFASRDHEGEIAGYVRLVLADAIGTFPFQNHCVALNSAARLPPPYKAAEVSRLMVHASHRRQTDTSPEILCSLFREMYMRSVQHGVRYWYAAMERPLVRVLQRMVNIEFQQIGPVTDYYGPVAPYLIDLDDLKTRREQPRASLVQAIRQAEALC